jgi:hypothetical protein
MHASHPGLLPTTTDHRQVVFPPLVENREDVWAGATGSMASMGTCSSPGSPARRVPSHTSKLGTRPSCRTDPSHNGGAGGWEVGDLDNPIRSPSSVAPSSKARFLTWLEATFQGEGLELGAAAGTSSLEGSPMAKQSTRKVRGDTGLADV